MCSDGAGSLKNIILNVFLQNVLWGKTIFENISVGKVPESVMSVTGEDYPEHNIPR